jgi:hypothetical protein
LAKKIAPPGAGQVGCLPREGGAYWCSAAGERFEGFAKKRGGLFGPPLAVLAARRLDDSRLGVDPHWGTDLRHRAYSAGIVTARVIAPVNCNSAGWASASATGADLGAPRQSVTPSRAGGLMEEPPKAVRKDSGTSARDSGRPLRLRCVACGRGFATTPANGLPGVQRRVASASILAISAAMSSRTFSLGLRCVGFMISIINAASLLNASRFSSRYSYRS